MVITTDDLSPDRLGQAYCRLNCWEWDPILGDEPEGFKSNPRAYVMPAIRGIISIIGEAAANKYWCQYECGKTEIEWFRWYTSPAGPFGDRLVDHSK